MAAIINKIFQILIDIAFGLAIYFGLKAFVPVLNDNVVMVITLTLTGIFAEEVEVKIKK